MQDRNGRQVRTAWLWVWVASVVLVFFNPIASLALLVGAAIWLHYAGGR